MLIPHADKLMLFPYSTYCSDCLYDKTQEKHRKNEVLLDVMFYFR